MKTTVTIVEHEEYNLFWQVVLALNEYLHTEAEPGENLNLVFYPPDFETPDGKTFEELFREQGKDEVEWDYIRILPHDSLEIDQVGLDRVDPDQLDVFATEWMRDRDDDDDDDDEPDGGQENEADPTPEKTEIIYDSPHVRAIQDITWSAWQVGEFTIGNLKKAVKNFIEKYTEPKVMMVPEDTPDEVIAEAAFEFDVEIERGQAQPGHILLA